MKNTALCVLVFLALSATACSSSDDVDVDGNTPPPPVDESLSTATDEVPSCTPQYSAIVPVHIDFAAYHCEGWTGKVFCEYSSLSSVYGPGWGQCQCYNGCKGQAKRGRSCRYRRCY